MELADLYRQLESLPILKFALTGLAGTCVSFPLYLLLNSKTSWGIAIISRTTNITAQAVDFLPHKMWSFIDGSSFNTSETFWYFVLAVSFLEVEARSLQHLVHKRRIHFAHAWVVVHIFTFFARFSLMRAIFFFF